MARQPSDAKVISDIIGQLEQLEPDGLAQVAAKAQELRQGKLQAAREAFIARVREEAAQLDLDPSTLFAPPSAAPRKQAARKRGKGVVADKYRHEDRAWSGRGKTPAWLSQLEAEGKNREQFRVDAGGNGEGSAG